MEENYKEFFEKIKEFKKQQDEQKKRGLNNYNMVNVVRKRNDEVGMHSPIIHSLINPNGSHYQDSLFLRLFLKELELEAFFGTDLSKVKVKIEYENIDLYLTNGKQHLIIENKIWAGDQPCQIIRYINLIVKINKDICPINDNKRIDEELLRVIYLTAQEKDCPDEHKLNGGYITYDENWENKNGKKKECFDKLKNEKQYKNYEVRFHKMGYKEHIINWINSCQKEVKNITNLYIQLQQYMDVVKKITKNYQGNVATLDSFALKQNDNFIHTLFKITQESMEDKYKKEIILTRGKILYIFFREFIEKTSTLERVSVDVKNINKKLESLVYTKSKCLKWFKQNHRVKNFGIFYKINDKYLLYLNVRTNNFHLSVMKHEKYILTSLDENDIEPIKNIEDFHLEKWETPSGMPSCFSKAYNLSDNVDIFSTYKNSKLREDIKKIETKLLESAIK